MGKLCMMIDPKLSVLVGHLDSGMTVIEVSNEEVAALNEAQRDILSRRLKEGTPYPVIVTSYGQPKLFGSAFWSEVVSYLDQEIAEAVERVRDEEKAEKEKAEALEQSVAKLTTMKPEDLIEKKWNSWELITYRLCNSSLSELENDPRISNLISEARALAKERDKSEDERKKIEQEKIKAEKEAKEAAEIAERDQWIQEHGSDRLRKALELGLMDSMLKSYREERLALDRPGWRFASEYDREDEEHEIREPSIAALDALASLTRAVYKLVWLVDGPDNNGDTWGREALVSDYLGQRIAFEIVGGRNHCS